MSSFFETEAPARFRGYNARSRVRRDYVEPMELNPVFVGFRSASLSRGLAGISKRLFDIVVSILLLAFTAPLLLVTAFAIRWDSPGPIIYRQKRIGYRGKEFYILKFRSMVTDAEKDGPRFAQMNDNRTTRVGRFIRKYRIDEIPQAINVLRGEMSFVGPRPERPEFVDELARSLPNYHCRHLVRPGITGWAQIKYEYAASVEGAANKLRYDLFYVVNRSFILDFLIVLLTFRVAIYGLGSR